MPKNNIDLLAVSYHEAGHAVIGIHCGVVIETVSIDPRRARRYHPLARGIVRSSGVSERVFSYSRKLRGYIKRSESEIRSSVIRKDAAVCIAGVLAQRLFLGSELADCGWSDDYEQLMCACDDCGLSREDADNWLVRVASQTVKHLVRKSDALTVLANILLRDQTVSGKVVRSIILRRRELAVWKQVSELKTQQWGSRKEDHRGEEPDDRHGQRTHGTITGNTGNTSGWDSAVADTGYQQPNGIVPKSIGERNDYQD